MVGTVAMDMHQFARAADHFGRVAEKQLPFAIMRTINGALFDARREIVPGTFNDAFDMHNRSFPRAAIRVDKASKASLEGSLFDHLGRASLGLHAQGGTKTAGGGNLAIPTRRIRKFRGTRGIRKSKRPRAFTNPETIRVTESGIFKGEGGRLVPLYFFSPTADIAPEFRFYQDFEREVERHFGRHFVANLQKAIASAR